MDKKLTDSEIVKALECCTKGLECKNCPANPHKGNYGYCTGLLLKDALDLINRLQAENERLTIERDNEHRCYLQICEDLKQAVNRNITARAKAYKEFAERLKKNITDKFNYYDEQEYPRATISDINNLLKELVGEGK